MSNLLQTLFFMENREETYETLGYAESVWRRYITTEVTLMGNGRGWTYLSQSGWREALNLSSKVFKKHTTYLLDMNILEAKGGRHSTRAYRLFPRPVTRDVRTGTTDRLMNALRRMRDAEMDAGMVGKVVARKRRYLLTELVVLEGWDGWVSMTKDEWGERLPTWARSDISGKTSIFRKLDNSHYTETIQGGGPGNPSQMRVL